jgi:hypothetical protein
MVYRTTGDTSLDYGHAYGLCMRLKKRSSAKVMHETLNLERLKAEVPANDARIDLNGAVALNVNLVHDETPMRALAGPCRRVMFGLPPVIMSYNRAWHYRIRRGHCSRPALALRSWTLKRPCAASLVNRAN